MQRCPSERWHKSTTFREIKRNFWADDAFPKKYAGYFRTKPVMSKIMKAVRDLPHPARKSITLDRGSGFVSWPHLQAGIGTQTWFCDPSSPWQKGTVENTSRRARSLSADCSAIACRSMDGCRGNATSWQSRIMN